MNKRKTRLALYVHDFKLEIGHSNSLIELIRHLPVGYLDQFSEIRVVAFSISNLSELFPGFNGKLTWSRVPFLKIKPVLLKSIFYQVWTFFYNQFFLGDETFKIGIGISSLSVDSVSIQFIHHIWTERGLEQENNHGIRKIYKKLLFSYFEACEKFLFKKKGLKFFSPAHFLTDFLKKNFPGIEAKTIYSGVNLARFELNQRSKSEVLEDLVTRYPLLKGLNTSKPIYLFIGAYERKGLTQALELVSQVKGAQFIVIGSPSAGKPVIWPNDINVYPITFTKEVPLFYALSDAFIFPTIYEPFGLVLFEAMAMGLTIVTRYDQVGASELLKGLPEVYFTDEAGFSFLPVEVKDDQSKKNLRNERIKLLGDVSWNKAGQELAEFI